MSDFECLMQILGTETHKDIKEHLLYLLKEEIQEAFKENWIFPKDMFEDLLRDIWEEVRDELKKKYKKQIKEAMNQKILEILESEE